MKPARPARSGSRYEIGSVAITVDGLGRRTRRELTPEDCFRMHCEDLEAMRVEDREQPTRANRPSRLWARLKRLARLQRGKAGLAEGLGLAGQAQASPAQADRRRASWSPADIADLASDTLNALLIAALLIAGLGNAAFTSLAETSAGAAQPGRPGEARFAA
jgi:hypothetical protein